MKSLLLLPLALLLTCCNKSTEMPPIVTPEVKTGPEVSIWLTYPDRTFLFSKVTPLSFRSASASDIVLKVDTTQRFQEIDGFGYSLTGGSAMLLNKELSASARAEILKELFTTEENGIGVSYLRVSIGASDLDERVFSYNDLPAGETDVDLVNFSLDPDRENLIPVLKEILQLDPTIKIMGSPWSSPTWMKTNGLPKGGSLKPEYYASYAQYFVKYIQGMAAEGITIDAITIQNEPENPHNTPSLLMTAPQQADFIKNHLGPAFAAANITTKIVLFDHNCDNPQYPISILDDAAAKPYVNGSAFHLYLGEIKALSTTRNAHPDKAIYFTEQWTSGDGDFGGDLRWHVKNLIVGATRNWSRNVLEWNLAADENFEPHTNDGGCTSCLGALTIDEGVTRNVSYYIIAHASKLVRPGAVRVSSPISNNVNSVAFQNTDGSKVLIVVNDNNDEKVFSIEWKGQVLTTSLPGGGVGTYKWR